MAQNQQRRGEVFVVWGINWNKLYPTHC